MQFEPSASVAPQTPVHRSEVFIRSLDHLFAMAQRYRSEGRIRESMDILWTLSNDHSETPQGRGITEQPKDEFLLPILTHRNDAHAHVDVAAVPRPLVERAVLQMPLFVEREIATLFDEAR